ncbi:PREDICTED: uncharacterized protein LOC106113980 [Papilio xuthus]|uniref:Uncharacterized protein LOC106113980 n=1 Tax=Papilio xuthus TaxID=66420 RepID=A0AAJ7E4K6_PAPXU|nr:PREDICTED: uncharacterized protein LOC106113980 [Papilio xuthus]
MILLSTPTLIYGIFIITKCINSYILLTANLGDFRVMAKKIIQGNVAEILSKVISITNEQSIKDVSSDKSDYLDDYKSINLRRSFKTGNSETEESEEEIIEEANRYVIEQLGKHIKERVIDDLVTKFLRNKFNIDRTSNTQKGNIRNTEKKLQYHKKSNIKYNRYDNIKKSTETSMESEQLQNKRWKGKNYAKNFNNEVKEILLKRKQPENKPTLNPNELKRPRYTIKNSVRNRQVKGNEIFVILQPKLDSTEKNTQDIKHERKEKNKITERDKTKTTTTRKFRFIKKTRKEHVTPQLSNKAKETHKKTNTSDVIYEKIKLNTNYDNNDSEKDEKIKEAKDKRIKSNFEGTKDKVKFSKESDVVKAITSYLWVDGEDDDIQEKEPNEGNSKELSSRIIKSKKKRKQTTPYNYEVSPTLVEKYDFAEPIPEKDRIREVIKTIRKPPSRINKKQKE